MRTTLHKEPKDQSRIQQLSLFILVLFLCYGFNSALAQKGNIHPSLIPVSEPRQGFGHFMTKTPWLVQVGGNVIDDDGKPFSKVFDTRNSWNVFPSARVAVEKECRSNWNIELGFSYNNLKAGKTLNNTIFTNDGSFMAVDLNGKKILTRLFRIEPFVFVGLGYTMRSVSGYRNTATFNAGLGFNIWIVDNRFGITAQSCGKFGLTSPIIETGSNYLQHSAGLIFKLSGNDKRLKAAKAHLKTIYTR